MKTIDREYALRLLSADDISKIEEQKIRDTLWADYIDEDGESIPYDSIYDPEVQDFLIQFFVDYENYGVSNEFLLSFLAEKGYSDVKITPKEPNLEICDCCHYRTLRDKTDYGVCQVCFWLDDGSSDKSINDGSPQNGMTLRQARANFLEFGACSKKALQFVKPKERFVYGLENESQSPKPNTHHKKT